MEFDIEIHIYDIEDLKLICLLRLPFCEALQSCDIERKVKPIIIKKHGHRAKSIFKYGLEYITNTLLNPQKQGFEIILSKIVM
ncbi:MAG: hypothetical protein M9887_10165 [Chitinophagales bacterium]|nr:hypothetical protein [Chitinophagales bacterium]